jgi:murein DD-endopeptidase MepM/ murein hydrolase activator NlpD
MSAIALCLIAVGLSGEGAQANHDNWRYKFPCRPADHCYVTTLAHPTNALDFDPKGSAGLGDIISASEGTFIENVTQSAVCTTSGLGKFAEVQDVHGRTLRYSHLSAFVTRPEGTHVQQGDTLGLEGNTGFTINCEPHLHLQGISTAPGINGTPTANLQIGPDYHSTNSVIGGISQIRVKYDQLGYPFGSWATVGWTHDISGSGAGCPSSDLHVPSSHCRLDVYYVPDVQDGHWGSTQNFRGHAEPGEPINSGLQWHRWSSSNPARWVQRNNGFFSQWIAGGVNPNNGGVYPIGLAVTDRIGNYQRFHVGFIKIIFPYTVAQFCPDIIAGPAPGNPGEYDGVVAGTDLFAVLGRFGESDVGLAPWQAWPNSWYDLNGDGGVSGQDHFLALGGFNLTCT